MLLGVYTCFRVGVANRNIIPDQQMTASSYYPEHLPANGRLYNSAGGWCAQASSGDDDDEWLQIDLGQPTRVCMVKTQGDGGDNSQGGSVMEFKLSFSGDGIAWTTYKDKNGKDVVRLNISKRKDKMMITILRCS